MGEGGKALGQKDAVDEIYADEAVVILAAAAEARVPAPAE